MDPKGYGSAITLTQWLLLVAPGITFKKCYILHPVFISVINQLDAQFFCFTISLFHASRCFEHMCSKHVEAWNKLTLKQKFCASSWLITEINILRCTVSKTSKLYILFLWISEKTAIMTLYSINWLVFITKMACLLRGIKYYLSIIQVNLSL